MRKLALLFLTAICGLCLAFSLTACTKPDEQVSQGLKYEIFGNRCTVTGIGTFEGEYLVIPSEYEGIPVTSIGQRAFDNCKQLISVTLPSSIKHIGNNAFDGCSFKNARVPSFLISYIPKDDLETVVITSGKEIPANSFAGCEKLKNVTLPNSLTSIGMGAFSNCDSLTNITIPDSVTSIGMGSFSNCQGLTKIEVGKNNQNYHSQNNCLIETASKTLMLGCKNSVIPDDGSVISIADCAFENCLGLTSITIPNSVTSIGDFVFSHCENLTDFTIPSSVTSIGIDVFGGCDNLKSVTFLDDSNWLVVELLSHNTEIVTVTDASKNVEYFTKTYPYYTWEKIES